jgi:hypothetical protein
LPEKAFLESEGRIDRGTSIYSPEPLNGLYDISLQPSNESNKKEDFRMW